MGLSRFTRSLLGPMRFPTVRGQEMPDPVGENRRFPLFDPLSRFVTQGWDRLNPIKSPPPSPMINLRSPQNGVRK